MNVQTYNHDMVSNTVYKFGEGDFVRVEDYKRLHKTLK